MGKVLLPQRKIFHKGMWINYKLLTGKFQRILAPSFPQKFCPQFKQPVEKWISNRFIVIASRQRRRGNLKIKIKSQTRIDIGGDILNMVLQGSIAGFQSLFHLIDGVKHGGVILAQLFTDIRGG